LRGPLHFCAPSPFSAFTFCQHSRGTFTSHVRRSPPRTPARGEEIAIRKSELIQVSIERAYHEAYAILAEPRNYPLWSPVAEALFEPVGTDGLSYRVELPRGVRILRFSAPNPYGVLDYMVIAEGEERGPVTASRLVPNEDGCELIVILFQRDDQTDEKFRSDVEWARADFNAIKLVIETF